MLLSILAATVELDRVQDIGFVARRAETLGVTCHMYKKAVNLAHEWQRSLDGMDKGDARISLLDNVSVRKTRKDKMNLRS